MVNEEFQLIWSKTRLLGFTKIFHHCNNMERKAGLLPFLIKGEMCCFQIIKIINKCLWQAVASGPLSKSGPPRLQLPLGPQSKLIATTIYNVTDYFSADCLQLISLTNRSILQISMSQHACHTWRWCGSNCSVHWLIYNKFFSLLIPYLSSYNRIYLFMA